MGRVGHVDDIAGVAVLLAGQTLHVDGGTSAAGGWCHHSETGDYTTGAP